MKNFKSIILTSFVVLVFAAVACDEKPDLYYPQTKDFCGHWVCTIETEGDPEDIWADEFAVYTYNTAADNDSIWVTDEGIISEYSQEGIIRTITSSDKVSFGGTSNDPSVDIVRNGKIFKDAVQVKPKYLEGKPIVVDSIDFVVDFYLDDELYSIHCFGHRYTGWEDYVQ